MPKIIEELKETILAKTKEILLSEGYDALTVRSVAKASGIATGTVYNYFSSKDVMVASVMLEDWIHALHRMQEAAEEAPDVIEGLRRMSGEIRTFSRQYSHTWEQYKAGAGAVIFIKERHRQLIGQLVELIECLLKKHDCWKEAHLAEFLAENLLARSQQGEEAFEMMVPILQKLLQSE
ncbi:MAG: TetR/AcrR family transcriptional regulator [Lachnospiraceae bacterium]|nr:TetR/AcrR family transcriptional regulator [Lachnospiraceae bacterium]